MSPIQAPGCSNVKTAMWFRRDLRLGDNPAWSAATRSGDEVVPVFVIDPPLWNRASPPRRALLAGHLRALDEDLAERGGRLHVVEGQPTSVLPGLVGRLGIDVVHWNADYTPYARRRDELVASSVRSEVRHGQVVHPPGSILTKTGGRYRVFTPFHRRWADRDVAPTLEAGRARLSTDPGHGIPEADPSPLPAGEAAALDRLEAFDERVDEYVRERDRPDLDTTSRLSADLKWGTIGPRTIIDRLGPHTSGRAAFVRQLAWRDFYADLLDAVPDSVDAALRPEYRAIEWEDDPSGLEAWKTGRTGYPIVDAGMRQLRSEGWMHNRVRMIVASFLVKDLLIDWRLGERHFRHHLLDADVASNVGNWQWAAGTGADAAPYFRIFNPVSQSKKFDPAGDYIRRWVPELRGLEAPGVHQPWTIGPLESAAAGVVLGDSYPHPIVDHAEARERALTRYKRGLDR
jgi:deoxyribodipyrimidine photo-lyase